MSGDSLSLPADGINRLALSLSLLTRKPLRPAIICTVVRLLWVNMGHLSGSPLLPNAREVTEAKIFCIFSVWLVFLVFVFLHKDVVMQFHYLVFKQGLWRYEDIESQLSVHLRDDLLCKQQRQPVGCRQLVLACSTVTSSTYGCQQVVGHLRWYHFGSPVWKVFWMMSVCMQAPLIPSCKG